MGAHISDEKRAAIEDALRRGLSVNAISRLFKAHIQTVRAIRDGLGIEPVSRGDWRTAAKAFKAYRHSQTFNADGTLRSESVALKPPPGEEFKPPSGHSIKGVSALLDPEGRVVQQWVKTREGQVDPVELARLIREVFAEAGPPSVPKAPPAAASEYLTVYPLPDLHLGMLSWGKETGQDWDLDIAQREIMTAVDELFACSPASDKAVVLVMGDYFHQNDQTNTTQRSKHQLDVDGRYAKVADIGARLIRRTIDRALEKHAHVTFRALPGNHDGDAHVVLNVSMGLLYENSGRVHASADRSPHWYMRHGSVLLGATHGHTLKPADMAMMMAADRPEDWGASKFRHFFFGHVHHDSAKEVGAVKVESFNSPAARDAYAHAGGWRSGRALNAITFCARRGERHRHRVPL